MTLHAAGPETGKIRTAGHESGTTRTAGRGTGTPRATGREGGARSGKRFSPRVRKALLALHLMAVGTWLGLDVVLAVLVYTALSTDDTVTMAVSYEALGSVVTWPLPVTAGLVLGTGVLLGLGTRYGLLRYRWVVVKLVLTVVMTLLVLFALRPDIGALAATGRTLLTDGGSYDTPLWLVSPPTVSIMCMVLLIVISVFKPWGRTRRRRTGRAAGVSGGTTAPEEKATPEETPAS